MSSPSQSDPPIRRKRDHAHIQSCIEELKRKYAGEARSWWPSFVFHYTNLQNAASILNQGVLLSRAEALRQGLMITDNASRPVMGHTLDKWKDYVRLYFRPRTPTQIRNEGIRPPTQQYLESHCPVPIFLLFDSVEVLTRQETRFSDGSLARAGAPPTSLQPISSNYPFQRSITIHGFRPIKNRISSDVGTQKSLSPGILIWMH